MYTAGVTCSGCYTAGMLHRWDVTSQMGKRCNTFTGKDVTSYPHLRKDVTSFLQKIVVDIFFVTSYPHLLPQSADRWFLARPKKLGKRCYILRCYTRGWEKDVTSRPNSGKDVTSFRQTCNSFSPPFAQFGQKM